MSVLLKRVILSTLLVIILSLGFIQRAQGQQLATPPPTNTPRGSVVTPIPTATEPATKPATKPDVPQGSPTLVIMGTYETPSVPPTTAIPPAAPAPAISSDVTTILLLGSDTITAGAAARTDVIILVAIDRTNNTVSMLQFPRDLYVYAPNYTMAKFNTIMNYGENKYGAGGGAKLVEQTIQYNFGIKVDHYVHVNFVGFQNIIAKLGGLDISVDCAIQDYKLKNPKLDYSVWANFELYTLPIGFRHLDPYTALWYVRIRHSTGDIDRGRRQMQVLRAIWRKAKDAGLLTQITELWPEAQKFVDTDLTLPDVVGMLPVALAVEPERIQRLNIGLTTHFTQWYTSDDGQYALLPKPDVWKKTIQDFVSPPPANRLGGEAPTVELGAAFPIDGYDQTAADTLSWEGFVTKVLGKEGIIRRDTTLVYDYTGGAKIKSLNVLMKALRIDQSQVVSQPDPNRTVDFRVEMGKDYASCLYALPAEFIVPPPAAP